MSLSILVAATLISAPVIAEVNLHLDEGVRLHAVDGKAYSDRGLFSAKPMLTLADGVHQIVVDYQAEVGRNRDDSVIEASDAFVILFEAEDESLTLSAEEVSTRKQMEDFNEKPEWVFHDDSEADHQFRLDVLEKTGFQLVRDYEREIAEFNKGPSKAALSNLTSVDAESNAAARSMPPGEPVDDQEMVIEMLRYWYMKADEKTKSEMKHWINSGE
ncbi:YccT family protein [Marinobacter zhanjiangensis]|nr:DUF2057 domain-containing protein [Marinobacter zhanjiangensis]